ncbi:MAG: RdgB/HAM1 family non-canonical purine NTP pyrophosphatase [Chloroflexota bacterium]
MNKKITLLVATHNPGKVQEYAEMLPGLDITWLTLDSAGIRDEVEETGQTFQENAELKAVAYAQQSGLFTLADDSGLEVDALDGRPGVLTARYGGPGLTPEERYRHLLAELEAVEPDVRTARFRCTIALAGPDGEIVGTSSGVCEGEIALEPAGGGGFGYDPVFFLPGQGVTMAQLSAEEKHQISHRGQALRAIAPLLHETLA